ncbi:hypothetical protein JQN64_27365 [Escherichia coli]|nr:hypothetical protein [Escherichia coli]
MFLEVVVFLGGVAKGGKRWEKGVEKGFCGGILEKKLVDFFITGEETADDHHWTVDKGVSEEQNWDCFRDESQFRCLCCHLGVQTGNRA